MPSVQRCLKSMATLLLVCLLAACSRGQISRDTTFDAQSEDGLVVLGLTTNSQVDRNPPILFWTAYNAAVGELGPDYKIVSERTDDADAQLDPARLLYEDPGGHRFLVFALPAGTWILERIFFTVEETLVEPYTVDDVLDENTVMITVGSGDAVYVGEIVYHRTRTTLKLQLGTSDLAAARAHIKGYPGVNAGLTERAMQVTSFECAREGDELAIAYCAPKSPRPLP